MAISAETMAFDRGVRPVAEVVFPDKAKLVLEFRPDPQLQARIEELAAKANEGTLTKAEREEYAGYVRANKFVAILKRLAKEVNPGT